MKGRRRVFRGEVSKKNSGKIFFYRIRMEDLNRVYFRIKQRCTRSDYFNHPILLLFTLLLS